MPPMHADFRDRSAAAGLRVFERGWLSSNNILFVDGAADGPAVLVDTGYGSHADQTVALVRSALGTRPLAKLVNTHLHSDHCGGNAALQAVYGCEIDVPAGEADKVDRWDEARLTYRDTGQHCQRFRRTGTLAAGDRLQVAGHAWEVLSAPGHDPESVILYQPDLELLISADALWEHGFGVVFPEIEGVQAFGDVERTLDRMAGLSVRWVIPGHGSPFADVAPALDRARSRLASFVADPRRHARHAAKVLIKFHLLEVRQQSTSDMRDWLRSTRYLRLNHAAHFGTVAFDAWCVGLLEELVASQVIEVEDDWVRDR